MMKSWLVAAILGGSLLAYAEEEASSQGEIKFYVGDKDGKPVDLATWSATLILEPKGMPKQNLKLELNQPKGKKSEESAVDHGGQVVDMEGGYKVEMVVEEGSDEEEPGKAEEGEGLADFEAKTAVKVYACPMKCTAPSEKAGKCSKCGMTLAEADLEFTAVVVFKTKDGTKNAKGFTYPADIPATFPLAVAKTEDHLKTIKALIDGGDLDKVHSTAEKISQICRKLPSMAEKDAKADVEKVCGETIALFKEIDEAADAGKKDATLKVYEEYVAKIAALKKHVK